MSCWTLLLLVLSYVTAAAAASLPPPVPVLSSDAGGPALYPFLPATEQNTGTGVLLVTDSAKPAAEDAEAAQIAQALKAKGLAAFILSYRKGADSAVADVNRALQFLRAHAADYKISPNRLGVMGLGTGAVLAANAAYQPVAGKADAPGVLERVPSWPNFMALIDGAALPAAGASLPPATFLAGSTNPKDNSDDMIGLWNYLRGPQVRVPVEAHFFPSRLTGAANTPGSPAAEWPDLFYNWVRAYGFLTDQQRVAIRGSVTVDGHELPKGFIILTPLDGAGAGPIVARVLNSTAGVNLGDFAVPANQGPVPGRYKVEVRQLANRWLSNSFSADLVRDPAFGHARNLSPSIEDQRSFTKAHPGDQNDLVVEIKPEANPDLKFEIFSH